MKRFALLAVVVFAVPLFAQQPKNDFQIFAYASDVGVTWSESYGTAINSNYGLALSKFVAPHWSMELSVSTQKWWEYAPGVIHFGDPIVRSRRTSYPVSLDGQYHFFNDSRWKPYLGGGVRYLENTTRFDLPTGVRHFSHRTVDPEIAGGVTFQFRPNLGLRFDAKKIIGSSSSILGDSALSGSAGLSFRF